MSLLRPHSALRDLALLAGRLIVGGVLVAHGLQKFGDLGAAGQGFTKMGVPMPELSAGIAATVETLGGLLIAVGLLTPLAGLAVAAVMAGAFWFAHREAGIFVTDGGWELVGALGSFGLALVAAGAGRYSLDHVLLGRRRAGDARVDADRRRVGAERESVGSVGRGSHSA